MIRKHLIASAVILLLGGCSSSKSDSTPDSGTPASGDSGTNTKTDTPVAVADTGAGDAGGTNPETDALLGDTGAGLADVGVKLDGTVVVDAPVDAATPDVNTPSPDTKPDTGSAKPDVAVDTAKPTVPDAASDTSKPVYDGGLAGSCIKGLFGTYVLRWDGIPIDVSTPANPQTVFEASTGLPLTGVTSVHGGAGHGCAALADGSAVCWQESAGNNQYGQLGNGTTTAAGGVYRATPVLTGPGAPLNNVVVMATGVQTNSSCAVTSDGKLWCWGDLAWFVNKGTALKSAYAQAITTDGAAPLTGVVSAALGANHACAVVSGTSNSVWCWGRNYTGELGLGDTTDRQYPTKVLGLASPTKVAMTYDSYPNNWGTTCALDGTGVKCWGHNNAGQAGANVTTASLPSPTTVVVESGAALDGAIDIIRGDSAFAILRSSNTIWVWGLTYKSYAANYGQTNVVAVGLGGPTGPRFLTSDGVYHNGTTTVNVNCNAL